MEKALVALGVFLGFAGFGATLMNIVRPRLGAAIIATGVVVSVAVYLWPLGHVLGLAFFAFWSIVMLVLIRWQWIQSILVRDKPKNLIISEPPTKSVTEPPPKRTRKRVSKRASDQKDQSIIEAINYATAHAFATVKSGREVDYSGDKTPVIHQTLSEIKEKYDQAKQFQKKDALAPFLGKWMPLEGTISDIGKRQDRWILHITTQGLSLSIECEFTADVSHAEHGDRVRLIGKLDFNIVQFSFRDCELLREIWRPD